MKKMLQSPVLFTLFLVSCGVICVSLLTNIQRSLNRKAGLNQMQSELAQLKNENAELKKKIETAKDPVVREKKIRDELNYSRPDEKIVQMSRPIPVTTPDTLLNPLPTKTGFQPPIQQWIALFTKAND